MESSSLPPWRSSLEEALVNNSFDQHTSYVSLAMIKPSGRPANRTVFFRGFLESQSPSGEPQDEYDEMSEFFLRLGLQDVAPPTLKTPSSPVDTSNLLLFVVDARSGVIRDFLHGSMFGEVCWFMPSTLSQFRISGSLHPIIAPTHDLFKRHEVPAPFANDPVLSQIDWEAVRTKMWNKISSLRRASFCWPRPGEIRVGTPSQFPLDMPSLVESLPSGSPQSPHIVCPVGTTRAPGPFSLLEEADEATVQKHSMALENFCLLVLEADGVDHLEMSHKPHMRFKYQKLEPSGWEKQHLNP